MAGVDVVVALEHIRQQIHASFILVWDHASTHRSREVKQYLAAHPEIDVEWLPTYAPELNPEEFCHGNVKQHLKNATPENRDQVRDMIDREFARIRKRPDLMLGFFHRAGLALRRLW